MSVVNHEIIKKNPELNMRYSIITCTNAAYTHGMRSGKPGFPARILL